MSLVARCLNSIGLQMCRLIESDLHVFFKTASILVFHLLVLPLPLSHLVSGVACAIAIHTCIYTPHSLTAIHLPWSLVMPAMELAGPEMEIALVLGGRSLFFSFSRTFADCQTGMKSCICSLDSNY